MYYKKYLWHIPLRDDFKDAMTILSLILLAERKLNEKYISIIDFQCGNGRYHPYLRDFGFDVWGVDFDKNLLHEAKIKNKGYENNYILADVRKFKSDKKFDVALNWFLSFGYYSDEENFKILENMVDCLRNNGILILDLENKDFDGELYKWKYGIQLHEPKENIYEICGGFIDEKYEHIYSWLIKIRPSKIELLDTLHFKIRRYSIEEIRDMLIQLNMEIIFVFGNKSLEKFDKKKHLTMQVVARKIE